MNVKVVDKDMDAAGLPVQRLCNEIQLFDLCDLETCSYKDGRFCNNSDLLTEFEQINDAEVVRPVVEDLEEGEDACEEEYDDAYEDNEFDDDAEYDD